MCPLCYDYEPCDAYIYLVYLRFLVMAYVVLLVTGLLGNMVIIWSVLWHHSMRTARNVFIMTLAISDLILCLFTMPTTLWEVRERVSLVELRVSYIKITMT